LRLPGQLRFDQQVSYYDDHYDDPCADHDYYDDPCADHYDDHDYCGGCLHAHRRLRLSRRLPELRPVWTRGFMLLRAGTSLGDHCWSPYLRAEFQRPVLHDYCGLRIYPRCPLLDRVRRQPRLCCAPTVCYRLALAP
jgi:hypothetical protein